jgi:hypothetical protein
VFRIDRAIGVLAPLRMSVRQAPDGYRPRVLKAHTGQADDWLNSQEEMLR